MHISTFKSTFCQNGGAHPTDITQWVYSYYSRPFSLLPSFIFSHQTTQKSRVAHNPKAEQSPPTLMHSHNENNFSSSFIFFHFLFHLPFVNTHLMPPFLEMHFTPLPRLNLDRRLGPVSTNLEWNSHRKHRPNHCIM